MTLPPFAKLFCKIEFFSNDGFPKGNKLAFCKVCWHCIFLQVFRKISGKYHKCWAELGETGEMLHSSFYFGLAKQVALIKLYLILQWIIANKTWNFLSGGLGPCKALSRALLEQKVDRQRCQREDINNLFRIEHPYSELAAHPKKVIKLKSWSIL